MVFIPGLGRYLLEKGIVTHSSTLAWRIHGQSTLAGYGPWGHKESDMSVATEHAHTQEKSVQNSRGKNGQK